MATLKNIPILLNGIFLLARFPFWCPTNSVTVIRKKMHNSGTRLELHIFFLVKCYNLQRFNELIMMHFYSLQCHNTQKA